MGFLMDEDAPPQSLREEFVRDLAKALDHDAVLRWNREHRPSGPCRDCANYRPRGAV